MAAPGNPKLRLELTFADKATAGIRKAVRRINSMTAPVRKVTAGLRAMGRAARFDRMAAGAKRFSGSIAGALTSRVTRLASAIGTVLIADFARKGVEAAAAYESLGVRLRVLTGNAEGARKVLEGVDRLATKTPFSLEELGGAAASMSVIFKDNTKAVSEFTSIASDLAAAYGKPVEQIAENLQRAFSAGIGSADVLREAGITAEIFRLTGATKPAEVGTSQLVDALRRMTAEGGPAFRAAAEQARTLQGSISNTGIAFGNFQRSVGEALAPLVGPFLTDRVIPFFERLKALVDGNAGALRGGLMAAVQSVQGVWSRLSSGFRESFGMIMRVSGGTTGLGSTLRELGSVVVDVFELFGGWEAVGARVGAVVGLIAAAASKLSRVLGILFSAISKIIGLVKPYLETGGDFLAKIGGSAFSASSGVLDDALGAAERFVGGGSSTAELQGELVISVEDGRVVAKSADISAPGVSVPVFEGSMMAPAQ